MMRGITSLSVVAVLLTAFFAAAFADTIHLRNGEIIENAVITEITQTEIKYRIGERATVYTISKSDALKVVHADGTEDVFEAVASVREHSAETRSVTDHYRLYAGYSSIGAGLTYYRDKRFSNNDGRIKSVLGYGLGISSEAGLAASLDYRRSIPLNIDYQFYWGAGITIGTHGAEPLALYAGYQYDRWLLELGLSLGGNYDSFLEEDVVFLRAGMEFDVTRERKFQDGNRVRYFRPGVEYSYPITRSDLEFWDNEFHLGAAGLFFRIGPEPLYFTTGAFVKAEEREMEYNAGLPVNIMGIPIGNIPLVDLTLRYVNWSMEVPLLLNYRLVKQVRFTGGALLDFNVDSWFDVGVSSNLPWNDPGWSAVYQFDDELNDMISEHAPTGNLYWAIGIDFDIFRYWGIGVKYIIHNSTFGGTDEFKEYFEPSQHQVRLSTYFVF